MTSVSVRSTHVGSAGGCGSPNRCADRVAVRAALLDSAGDPAVRERTATMSAHASAVCLTLDTDLGWLITIRFDTSYFEVTRVIESRLQRKLMEYVTHAGRVGLAACVDEVSAPGRFSCSGNGARPGDEVGRSPYRVQVLPRQQRRHCPGPVPVRRSRRPRGRRCVSASPSATANMHASTWTRTRPSSASFPKSGDQRFPGCWTWRWPGVFEDAAV